MKRTISIFSALRLVASGSLVFCVLVSGGCKKRASEPAAKPGDMYVRAEGGLRMRAEPRTDSPVIFNIPDGERIELLPDASEEVTIDGKKGRFRKVEHRKKTGWAFDAFFSTEAPPIPAFCKSFAVENGIGACEGLSLKDRLITAAGKKYEVQRVARHNRSSCVLEAEERSTDAPHEVSVKPAKDGFSVRITKTAGSKTVLECQIKTPVEAKAGQ